MISIITNNNGMKWGLTYLPRVINQCPSITCTYAVGYAVYRIKLYCYTWHGMKNLKSNNNNKTTNNKLNYKRKIIIIIHTCRHNDRRVGFTGLMWYL